MKRNKTELVPEVITQIAEAFEQGKTIYGGQQFGKTLALQMAAAKPVKQEPALKPTIQPPRQS